MTVNDEQPTSEAEIETMFEAASDEVFEMIEAYEPIEALYRNAVTPPEVYPEASNTTGLPTALVVNASSAR